MLFLTSRLLTNTVIEDVITLRQTFTGLAELQKYNKESLILRCRNSLSIDWLTDGKSFPLQGFYVGLDWTKTIKRALKDERVPMSSIHDLFKNLKANSEPFRILIKGTRIQ